MIGNYIKRVISPGTVYHRISYKQMMEVWFLFSSVSSVEPALGISMFRIGIGTTGIIKTHIIFLSGINAGYIAVKIIQGLIENYFGSIVTGIGIIGNQVPQAIK